MQEVLAVAIEVEVFQASEKQHQRQGRFTTNVIATQVAETRQETFDSSISKILAEMKKDREEQRHLLEDFMKKMTSPERWQNMGVWGLNRVGRGNCWNCGQPGHFSRNCPFQENNKLRERAQERAEPKGLSSVPPCRQRPACSPRARTLRGTHYQLGLYVSSKVDGVGVRFLVDTGSNITLLSPAVVAKIDPDRQPSLESVENHMILTDGSAKPFRGRGTFELEMNGKRIRQEIWIADIELEGILCMDFVRKYGCQIVSAPEGELQLFIPDVSTASKAELADSTRSNTRQCFRVAVEDTVVIPANSALITAAKVLDECGNGGVGILEPTKEFVRRSKLLVGRSLVQMEGTIPIRLLNPTPYPRLVYRSTLVLCEAVDGLQEVPQKVDTNVRLARDSQDENRIQNEPLPPDLEELFARGHLRVASQRQKRLYGHKSHTNSYREGEKVWLYNPQKRGMAVQPTEEKRPRPKIRDSMGRALDGNQASYGRGLLYPEKSQGETKFRGPRPS